MWTSQSLIQEIKNRSKIKHTIILVNNSITSAYQDRQDQSRDETDQKYYIYPTAQESKDGKNKSNNGYSTVILLRSGHNGSGCWLGGYNHSVGSDL